MTSGEPPVFLEALDPPRQGIVLPREVAVEPYFVAETALKLRALTSQQILLSDSQLVDHRGLHDLLQDRREGRGFRDFLAERTVVGMRRDADSLFDILDYHLGRVPTGLVFSGMSPELNGHLRTVAGKRAWTPEVGVRALRATSEGAEYLRGLEVLDDIYRGSGNVVTLGAASMGEQLRKSRTIFADENLEGFRHQLVDGSDGKTTRTTCFVKIWDWALSGRILPEDADRLREFVDDAYNRSFWDQPKTEFTPVLSPRTARLDAAGVPEPNSWPERLAFTEIPEDARKLPGIRREEVSFDDLAAFQPTGIPLHVARANTPQALREGWVEYMGKTLDEFLVLRRGRHGRKIKRVVQVGAAVGAAAEAYSLTRTVAHFPAFSVVSAAGAISLAAYGIEWSSSWWQGRREQGIRQEVAGALFQSELIARPA